MKCFIASAFGYDDVDAIYDHCVIPILRKLGVTPLRVDRVEHNEDIDNKIFELLDSADLAIADLTYARPSVYYEAGYAAGKSKPVIYIAKRNHFKARDDDPHGNFRVHFDLQMRNIISWTDPDRAFSDKLLNRVRLVLRPLERANMHNLQLEAERSEFNRLPIYDRLGILQKTCIDQLRTRSFQIYPFTIDAANGTTPIRWTFLKRFDNTRYQGVGIITTSSATKQLLQSLSWNSLYAPSQNEPNFKLRESHYIVVSLKSIPRSRITEALPNMHLRNNTTLTSENRISRGTRSNAVYVHIIDGIKSVSEFLPAFSIVMDENGLTEGA
jgi:nucleoside 2-deoxyribosyltransferase